MQILSFGLIRLIGVMLNAPSMIEPKVWVYPMSADIKNLRIGEEIEKYFVERNEVKLV